MSASSLSRLVQALCLHFASTGAASEAAVSAQQYFTTAVLAAAQSFRPHSDTGKPVGAAPLSVATRQELETLTHELEQAVASPTLPCSPASLCSLVALVLVAWPDVDAAGRDVLRSIAARFEACALAIWASQPPFPAEVQAAVTYGVAQLLVRTSGGSEEARGLCEPLLDAATLALAELHRANRRVARVSDPSILTAHTAVTLPSTSAVELIAECTALLVASRPPRLAVEALNPNLMSSRSAVQAGGSGGGGAEDRTGGKRSSRRAVNEGKGGATGDKASSIHKGSPRESDVPAAQGGVAALVPAPLAATVTRLRDRFMDGCLSAVGGGLAEEGERSGSGGAETAVLDSSSDEDTTSLVCRRILIPLLLLDEPDGGGGLARYDARIHRLLHTLGGAQTGDAVTDCRRRSEAVVLVAALFDALFPTPSRGGRGSGSGREEVQLPSRGAMDYRHSPFLWSLLRESFWDAATCTDLDPGRRATMQLRSEYLLKRIVDLCRREGAQHSSSPSPPRARGPAVATVYHEWFTWTPGCEESWEHFFLVLETLGEFGLHIVIPAMTKLDALVSRLQAQLESTGGAAGAGNATGALHACWVEVLFLKLSQHPNLGVRKLGLRRLWGLPPSVLAAFSPLFLYGHAFRSTADPRLCADLDRLPLPAAFLETSGLERDEDRAVPNIEPIAASVECFYGSLFLTHLRSAAARTEALGLLFGAVAEKPARFTVVVLARLFCHLARILVAEAAAADAPGAYADGSRTRTGSDAAVVETGGPRAWTVAMALDPFLLRALTTLMRETAQESTALWLDVRIVAMVFEALVHLAALDPARFRAHEGFWQLLCLCGPLGQSGGARVDACGTYGAGGAVGSSVDPRLLHVRLATISRELAAMAAGGGGGGGAAASAVRERGSGGVDPHWLVRGLVQPETLEARTERLLESASDGCGGGLAEAEVKAHFFLLGSLLLTGDARDRAVVVAVARQVAATVAGYRSRAYASESGFLTALAALVEVHRSVGGAYVGPALLEEDPVGEGRTARVTEDLVEPQPLFSLPSLAEIAATIYARARRALEDGLAAATAVEEAAVPHGERNAWGGGDDLDSPTWTLLHTSRWDVLAAAAMHLNQIAVELSSAHGAAALQTAELVQWLTVFLHRCAQGFRPRGPASGPATSEYASIVVARDASRLLQSVLCGLVYAPVSCALDGEAETPVDVPPYLAPLMQEAGRVGCFLNTMSSDVAADTIATLTGVLAQRQTASTAGTSSLSGQSSAVTLAEHFRYVYNAIFVLCQRVTEREGVRRTAVLLQDFGLSHVGQCWTSNLACVYDILLWVVATPGSVAPVDREAIITAMFDHVHDVSAKQHARVSALAFNALPHLYHVSPELVVARLLSALDADPDSDRVAYFTSICASLLMLRTLHGQSQMCAEGIRAWATLAPVLVRVAVMYNASRDEEESESCAAAAEPVMARWPAALRILYPPTVRLATVGRALAIATILRGCALDAASSSPHSGSLAIAQPLCLQLLEMNAADPVVAHEPCMPNSRTHRVRVRLWQLVNLLVPFLPQTLAAAEPVLDALLTHCISINNMGSVRRYVDLFAIKLLERQPLLHARLADAMDDFALRPQVLGTFLLVACHALLHDESVSAERREGGEGRAPALLEDRPGQILSSPSGRGDGDGGRDSDTARESSLYRRLFPLVLRQCTSNQHLLRIISHTGVYRLCRARLAHGKRLSPDTTALYAYIAEAPEHVKFRAKYEDALFYDTDEAATPRSILCVLRREANTVLRESVPAAAFERLRLVETEMCCLMGATYPVERLRARLVGQVHGASVSQPADADTAAATPNATQLLAVFRDAPFIPHTTASAAYYVAYTMDAARCLTSDPQAEAGGGGAAVHDGDGDARDNIQKKAAPWWGTEVYNELHPRALSGAASAASRRQRLIVVGSLLLNPVNIAGLCRCGEIFAVEQIVIPEKKVFDHPHFAATARSAELWIPWAEVPPRDLPAYLNERRQEGYTICGIEQTANSVSIASFEFPEKVVVVLGSEGQGIPAPLIPMLDVCVEIPQYGLIRSLNVHVTGAIVMYEHTKQRLMMKEA